MRTPINLEPEHSQQPQNSREIADILRSFEDETAKFLAAESQPNAGQTQPPARTFATLLPYQQGKSNFKMSEPVNSTPPMPQLNLF